MPAKVSLFVLATLAFLGSTGTRAYSYKTSGMKCGPGLQAGFVHNTYAYSAPLGVFTDVVKSFFNVSWYDGAILSNTTGKDNVPGATRSAPFGGSIFNETLTLYENSSDMLEFAYEGAGATWTIFPGPSPPRLTIRFGGYTEAMRFLSVCGGSATYIEVLTYWCVEKGHGKPVVAYDLWDVLHDKTFGELAVSLLAPVMPGDCPVPDDEEECETE